MLEVRQAATSCKVSGLRKNIGTCGYRRSRRPGNTVDHHPMYDATAPGLQFVKCSKSVYFICKQGRTSGRTDYHRAKYPEQKRTP